MKVLFLDIDGVLNSQDDFIENYIKTGEPAYHLISNKRMEFLKKIIGVTNAKIVVSSTWRIYFPVGPGWIIFMQKLHKFGLVDNFFGITHSGGIPSKRYGVNLGERGHEIQTWLNSHVFLGIQSFCILDDDSDMAHLKPYLVKTTNKHGLTENEVNKAIMLLNQIQ